MLKKGLQMLGRWRVWLENSRQSRVSKKKFILKLSKQSVLLHPRYPTLESHAAKFFCNPVHVCGDRRRSFARALSSFLVEGVFTEKTTLLILGVSTFQMLCNLIQDTFKTNLALGQQKSQRKENRLHPWCVRLLQELHMHSIPNWLLEINQRTCRQALSADFVAPFRVFWDWTLFKGACRSCRDHGIRNGKKEQPYYSWHVEEAKVKSGWNNLRLNWNDWVWQVIYRKFVKWGEHSN